jgi:hypothetical protein
MKSSPLVCLRHSFDAQTRTQRSVELIADVRIIFLYIVIGIQL